MAFDKRVEVKTFHKGSEITTDANQKIFKEKIIHSNLNLWPSSPWYRVRKSSRTNRGNGYRKFALNLKFLYPTGPWFYPLLSPVLSTYGTSEFTLTRIPTRKVWAKNKWFFHPEQKGNTYYRRCTFWISTTTLGGNWIKRGTRLREWAIPLWRHRKSDYELEGSNDKDNLTLVPTAVYSSEKCNRQAKNCNRKKLSKCLLIYDLYKRGFSKGR